MELVPAGVLEHQGDQGAVHLGQHRVVEIETTNRGQANNVLTAGA